MASTTYQYIAWSEEGVRHEGVKKSSSEDEVMQWLNSQNLTPISISAASERAARAGKGKARYKKIKSSEMSTFCWQLSTMIDGGMPIATALETIGEEMENAYLGWSLCEIAGDIKKGETLSDSVEKYDRVFNTLACSMIRAAELGGSLPTTLDRLAEYYGNRDRLARKIKGALSYPIFAICFIVIIIVAMMTFVIPSFAGMFKQMGSELPAYTKAFMGVYEFTKDNVLYILGAAFVSIVTFIVVGKTESGHKMYGRIALRLPLFGKLLIQAFVALFCRTLSTLMSSGVPALESFNILKTMTKNDVMQKAIEKTRDNVMEGAGISQALASVKFFPNIAVKMTEIGEESGSLPEVLDKTADYYEIKVESLISTLLSLLEPVLIVTVGGIVLSVILAMYLPIFTMGKH